MQNEEEPEGSELNSEFQLFKTLGKLYEEGGESIENLYNEVVTGVETFAQEVREDPLKKGKELFDQGKIEIQAAGNDVENLVDSAGRAARGEKLTKAQESIYNYAKNLSEYEGNYNNASFIHKPGADEKAQSGSGITIAQGLDATGTSRKQMEEYGVPERILKQMDGLQAWKLGKKATIPKDLKLERMTKEEFEKVTLNIANAQKEEAEKIAESYPDLTPKGIAILLNLKHWGGSLKSNKESKLTRHYDNVILGKKSETGELISPIQDALDKGGVTDKDLIEAMDMIRVSYEPWGKGKGSMRYGTVSKYIANLD